MHKADYVLPFCSIFGNFFLGAFVLFKDWKNNIHLSYGSVAMLTALWAFLVQSYSTANSAPEALLIARLSMAVFAFIPIPFIYFFSVFPKEDVVPKYYQLIAWFVVASFYSLISFSDLIVKEMVVQREGFAFIPGAALALFAIYFLGFLFFAFARLIERYNTYQGGERRQIAYVLLGFFLGFIFPAFSNLILPLAGYSQLAVFGPSATVITVGILAYAITKHHLMDISVVISRTLAWLLTVVFLGVIYGGLVWFYRMAISPSIDLLFFTWTVIYGIIVGETFQRIRLFIQTTSDKVFLRGKYDYYKELSDASNKVGQKLSLPDILKVLDDTFHEVVEISRPQVLLPEFFTETEKESRRYLAYSPATALPDKSGQEIRIDSQLVKDLLAKRGPIKRKGGGLAVPCLLEDRLIAVFSLGPKLSEDPYTEEDTRLLNVLANQVAIALDHTRSYEKIKTDLEVAERQLVRSQRLASLGTLTAGVTHEIRNPLTVIRAETERIANEARDLDYLKEYRELVLKHIDRISGIVQRMLGLAKEKERQITPVDLIDVINTTSQFFNFKQIKLIKELKPIPTISGNTEELHEVFVNLFQNAIEAMPNGGTLTVKTFAEDNRVAVEVSDTGKGIPEEIREKIFDPFYSTRHEGVGLGLSIVYRIVREHGADIKVTSEVGRGTTFKIVF